MNVFTILGKDGLYVKKNSILYFQWEWECGEGKIIQILINQKESKHFD